MSASDRCLVMATAVGYSAEQVRPFLRSLTRSGYRGDVVLFVDDALGAELEAAGIGSGLRLVRVPRWPSHQSTPLRRFTRRAGRIGLWVLVGLLRNGPAPALRSGFLAWAAGTLYAPNESRYLRYLHHLSRHRYERVLLVDARDVLFQSDPFPQLARYGLALSMEEESYTLASAPTNAMWIRLAYGEEGLERIGGNPTSCAGVTYGGQEDMIRYLELMAREILGLGRRGASLPGIDQAAHNWLLWTGALEPVALLRSLDSPVATLNGVGPDDVVISQAGRLLNADRSEPSVLHQYDRVPGLAERLVQTLCG